MSRTIKIKQETRKFVTNYIHNFRVLYYTVCIGLAVDGSRPGVYFNHLNNLEGGSEV